MYTPGWLCHHAYAAEALWEGNKCAELISPSVEEL